MCVAAVPQATARAQNTLGIAAIVNDDVISVYDLNSRLAFVVASTRPPDSQAARNRLLKEVLDTLIDEKLKLQEAKRLNIKIDPAEVDGAIRDMEAANNLPRGGIELFLKRSNISMQVLVTRLKADISWQKVVGRTQRFKVKISEEEITERLREIEANKDKPESRVSEIFLPVDNPNLDNQVRSAGEQLLKQLQSGASFQALARSYSKSPSAAQGGILGWLKQGQLDAAREAALVKMRPGQISPLLRSLAGYHILLLHDRRQSAEKTNQGDPTVSLHQIYVALPPKATAGEIQTQMKLAETLAQSVENCDDIRKLGKEMKSSLTGNLGTLKTSKLPEGVRAAVKDLPEGKASKPFQNGQAVVSIMVCKRIADAKVKKAKNGPTPRERIRRQLLAQRMGTAARRYLRDLRRAAFVDIRL